MLPDDVTSRDDEMDDERYEFPPKLMPSSEESYARIKHGDWLGIYTEGKQQTEIIKSDTTMEIQQ
jgi:hypothetical protein